MEDGNWPTLEVIAVLAGVGGMERAKLVGESRMVCVDGVDTESPVISRASMFNDVSWYLVGTGSVWGCFAVACERRRETISSIFPSSCAVLEPGLFLKLRLRLEIGV